MSIQQFAAAVFSLLVLASIAANAAPVIDSAARTRLDKVFDDAVAKHITPGGCIVIGTKDGVVFTKAYGHMTYDLDSPAVTLDTLYDMASCSKVVGTTSTLALLLQDGKISLDDPVSKYLPSWDRDDKRAITIRNLAIHTSGLPAYTSAWAAESIRKPDESHSDALIEHIADLHLQYETGKAYKYSCLNFLTLARVNETVAGTSQERFLRARLFEPLGMTDSGYYLRMEEKQRCAPTIGGMGFRQGVVHDPLAYYYRDGYHCPGNAGLFTTANDLTKFCRMILSDGKWGDKQIFTPRTIDMFSTQQIPEDVNASRGIGWCISDEYPYATSLNCDTKSACISHSGYTGTYILIDRLAGAFMVSLTNRVYPDDTASSAVITRSVRRIMLECDPIYRDVLEAPEH